MYWLLVLFSFPLLGSIVYFFAIFMPQSRLERSIGRAGAAVLRSLDPGRDLREAQNAFDLTPTAHNQVRLAEAMLAAGQSANAVAQFDACLAGPFARDPEILFGAARARLAHGEGQQALAQLRALRLSHPGFREAQLGLELAKASAQAGQHAEAAAEFASLAERHAGIEVSVEYAIWAIGQGQRAIAEAQLNEVAHKRKHMSRDSQAMHNDLFKRLDAARVRLN